MTYVQVKNYKAKDEYKVIQNNEYFKWRENWVCILRINNGEYMVSCHKTKCVALSIIMDSIEASNYIN